MAESYSLLALHSGSRIHIYDMAVPLNVYNALGDEKIPMVSYTTTWVSFWIPSFSLGLSAVWRLKQRNAMLTKFFLESLSTGQHMGQAQGVLAD